MVGQTDV